MIVIDTEVHVVHRVWPIDTNPERKLIEPYTWHEHSGDLLVQEMDRAGVNQAFLIGYDGYDFGKYMERFGSSADQFYGGRFYSRHYARKYANRFYYFTTLRDPRIPTAISELQRELDTGAIGVKIFPSYLEIAIDDGSLWPVYDLCSESDARLMYGLEDTNPPRTCSHVQYWSQMERVLKRYPNLMVQFNHGGAVLLPSPEADAFFNLVRKSENVFVSTSYLGGPFLGWPDEWRYPFPEYLRQLKILYEGLGPERLMWATDWPWLESYTKYPQLIDAIRQHADFMSDLDKTAYLGGNALRFLGARAEEQP